jgi:hypothetical protein
MSKYVRYADIKFVKLNITESLAPEHIFNKA